MNTIHHNWNMEISMYERTRFYVLQPILTDDHYYDYHCNRQRGRRLKGVKSRKREARSVIGVG